MGVGWLNVRWLWNFLGKYGIIVDMMVASLINWWYVRGWRIFVGGFGERLKNTMDFFSIGLLFKTLFAPYRQISANAGFADRLFSRCVGAVARIFIIIFGVLSTAVEAIFCVILAIVWPLVPVFPIACVVLAVMGIGNV